MKKKKKINKKIKEEIDSENKILRNKLKELKDKNLLFD